MRPRGSLAGRDPTRLIVLGGILIYGIVVLAGPLLALLTQAASMPRALLGAIGAPAALDALGKTALVTLLVICVNLPIGILGGLLLARHRLPARCLVDACVDLPLAVSPVMIGLGFLLIVGRQGILGPPLAALGIQIPFAFPGLVIATLFVTLPFVIREVQLLVEERGRYEEEAAATLGASGMQTFFWVTLPSLGPALRGGALLTVARSLGEFGAVLVLGGAIEMKTSTATTFIHLAIEERNLAGAYGVSTLLAALAIAMVGLLSRSEGS